DGTFTARAGAAPVGGIARVARLAAGNDHVCALLDNGSVRCWGRNDEGQLGDGSYAPKHYTAVPGAGLSTDRQPPRRLRGIERVVAVRAHGVRTCAVLETGAVRCWGGTEAPSARDAALNQVGKNRPVGVSGIANAKAIALGNAHGCALLADRTVTCW